ncbi:hypothetical protein [Streptomyces sp. NPDC006134]|uniref:hypothetical protein n=1 Tax=Streptomyces sp. NPDC006134 TaxID=3154467 RepID=UPI0033BFFC50
MYDLTPVTALSSIEPAADFQAAGQFVIEDLDGSPDNGVALFTICVAAAPVTGRHTA